MCVKYRRQKSITDTFPEATCSAYAARRRESVARSCCVISGVTDTSTRIPMLRCVLAALRRLE